MAKKSRKGSGGPKRPKTKTKQQRIAEAIAKCKNARGIVEPKRVVEAAKNPTNILHNEFEWDLGKAAHQAWLARARELIRECRSIVIYADRRIAYPIYVSNPQKNEGGYARTVVVAKNSTLKMMALEAELERIRSAIQRSMSLAIVFGIKDRFEALLQQVIEIETELKFE